MALLYAITASAAARPDSSMTGVFRFSSESSLWKFLVILSRSERIMRTCFSSDSTDESLILSMRSLLPADERANSALGLLYLAAEGFDHLCTMGPQSAIELVYHFRVG
jgi:hypothetical protein